MTHRNQAQPQRLAVSRAPRKPAPSFTHQHRGMLRPAPRISHKVRFAPGRLPSVPHPSAKVPESSTMVERATSIESAKNSVRALSYRERLARYAACNFTDAIYLPDQDGLLPPEGERYALRTLTPAQRRRLGHKQRKAQKKAAKRIRSAER